MSNSIKFRVWYPKGETYGYAEPDMKYADIEVGDEIYIHPGDDVIFMRCTEIKDCNGKTIYEDDIVRWKESKDNYRIFWWTPEFILISKTSGHSAWPDIENGKCVKLEVIGNLWENQELLKDEEKTN